MLIEGQEDLEKARIVSDRMVRRALALDGTCKSYVYFHVAPAAVICTAGTGEHGVGLGKRKYLYEELGTGTVEVMKTVKRALDPYNLFNPGKVCPLVSSDVDGLELIHAFSEAIP